MSNVDIEKLLKIATETREKAYAPYSQFKVGAVIKSKESDKLYVGNNVENSVNGASICAERTAVGAMVADIGENELEYVFVVSDHPDPATPCGVCLQVLNEFIPSDLDVYVYNIQGKGSKYKFSELMPHAYKGKEFLKK